MPARSLKSRVIIGERTLTSMLQLNLSWYLASHYFNMLCIITVMFTTLSDDVS